MLKPGVSSKLIFVLPHSVNATPHESDIFRAISSSSWSVGALPSSTRPKRGVAPAVYNMAEIREVFPACPWPTTARFLRLALSYTFTGLSFCVQASEFTRLLPLDSDDRTETESQGQPATIPCKTTDASTRRRNAQTGIFAASSIISGVPLVSAWNI